MLSSTQGGGAKDLTRKSSSKYGNHKSSSHSGQVTYRIDGQNKTLDDVIEVRILIIKDGSFFN
jgi:hypothetical protein